MQANTAHEFIGEVNGKCYYLGPEADRKMNWKEARAWCESLGENFELPSRIIMLMCCNNKELRKQFKMDDYYWLSDDYRYNTSLGWHQNFTTGGQGTTIKTDTLYVRAVRVE